VARSLPESARFVAADTDRANGGAAADDPAPRSPAARRQFRLRLALLSLSGFAYALFQAPVNQLLNDFLKDERGFSAGEISAFRFAISVPGVIGIAVGGRFAESHGRRRVGMVAVALGTTGGVVAYNVAGPLMWLGGVTFMLGASAAVPALSVYGPELFATSVRARANAVITTITVTGSATGLVLAGQLDERFGGFGPAMATLVVGPMVVIALLLAWYPETAATELEDLNPEDEALRGRFTM